MWKLWDGGRSFKSSDSTWDRQSGGATPTTSAKKPTNIVPVTVAQIHAIPESEENLKVGSVSAELVTFVAFVNKATVLTTQASFEVNDRTGPSIEVKKWLVETNVKEEELQLQEKYVRVFGRVRKFHSKRYVVGLSVRPISSLNEMTMHIAEVIHFSMSVTVMDKKNSASASGRNSESAPPAQLPGSSERLTSPIELNSASVSGRYSENEPPAHLPGSSERLTSPVELNSASASGRNSESAPPARLPGSSERLTSPIELVKNAVKNCRNDEGMHVSELFARLPHLSQRSIRDALDRLCEEGVLYSSIDEEHFKYVDCV